ncbi:hypothetical protein SD70_18835 [Gordoniibacillus kamchatkensis]|uniref:Uncharacterized protein n=1 Tax=Gordoniibacillus kamchatkensis TaxID=1590651 RepID=A0ABR5AF33_9BACL|nr:hypothetical protein [Paenibacillus sp. VKM B-2647]KIL39591.1 hypothetical protein SD70_18835 [Paenibacillus sp. VKM B-2647]
MLLFAFFADRPVKLNRTTSEAKFLVLAANGARKGKLPQKGRVGVRPFMGKNIVWGAHKARISKRGIICLEKSFETRKTSRNFETDLWFQSCSVFIMLNELVDPNVKIKLLTSFGKLKGDAPILAEKLKAQRPNFAMSNAKDFHDRYIIADDECFLLGASIKDFADKATTLVAINEKPVISSIKKYAEG